MRTRVLVADDHAILRGGLRLLLIVRRAAGDRCVN
jgi:hypothetical protein